MERDNGFLIYLSRTYRSMCLYLKRVHQTLDSWLTGQEKNERKLERREMMLYFASKESEVNLIEESEASEDVIPIVRLQSNI